MSDSFWEDVREGETAQPRTAPAELVTEEIVKRFAAAYVETTSYTAALRAVAPMIAERARENWMIANGSEELAASIRRARGETP